VVVKWFLNEPLRERAQALISPEHSLHAPDFYRAELLSTVCKRLRRREMDERQAFAIEALLPSLPINTYSISAPMLSAAFALAVEAHQSIYDCLFAVLAVELNLPLISADERFVRSMHGLRSLRAKVQWLGALN
jgi:predicted nucleic acid-binding protein